MRFAFHLVLMIAVALGVGFGLSWYALDEDQFLGALRVGPWTAWPEIGSTAPNPYARAYLARNGTLQLGSAEGIQFLAIADSDGEPLLRECTYRLAGVTPVTSFWTLVAADEDGTNIASPGTPLALHSGRIARAEDGSAAISVSRALASDNWLEIAGEGPFRLLLTLYDAPAFGALDRSASSLPTIRKERCA